MVRKVGSKVKGISQKGEFDSVFKFWTFSFYSVVLSTNFSHYIILSTFHVHFRSFSPSLSYLSSSQAFRLDPSSFPSPHWPHPYDPHQFIFFHQTSQDKLPWRIDKKTYVTVLDRNFLTLAHVSISIWGLFSSDRTTVNFLLYSPSCKDNQHVLKTVPH